MNVVMMLCGCATARDVFSGATMGQWLCAEHGGDPSQMSLGAQVQAYMDALMAAHDARSGGEGQG